MDNLNEAIEAIQFIQSLSSGIKYEDRRLAIAEAALVDLINFHSDGPNSNALNSLIKSERKQSLNTNIHGVTV